MIYIRTKSGCIFPTNSKIEYIDKSIYLKVSDTIEDLIMVGDVLTYSSCILDKVWKTRRGKLRVSKYTVDNLVLLKRINSFYIEDKNGNYIKVAKKGKSGGLELI